MEIKFYLQADPNFSGQLRVREYYDGTCYKPVENGRVKIEHLIGLVDEGVSAANRKEYDIFHAYVEKNDNKLYEAARAQPGVPYYFDYMPVIKREVSVIPPLGDAQ